MVLWDFVRKREAFILRRITGLQMSSMAGALDNMDIGDTHAWNSLIKKEAKIWLERRSLDPFEHMQQQGMLPDRHTFLGVICSYKELSFYKVKLSKNARLLERTEYLVDAKRMHSRVTSTCYSSDPVFNTAIINMYGKFGFLKFALVNFDASANKDIVMWTAIITVLVQNGQNLTAFQMYYQMFEEGFVPDRVLFICILDACVSAPTKLCQRVHVSVVNSNLESDVAVGTALVNMYGKSGNLNIVEEVFDGMIERNVMTWSAMIGAYVQLGKGKDALQLACGMMEQSVLPNEVTCISKLAAVICENNLKCGKQTHVYAIGSGLSADYAFGNCLVNMYGKCGTFEDAYRLFEELIKRDVVTFTTMMSVSVSNGKTDIALQLLSGMLLSGTLLDPVAFSCILEACGNPSKLSSGRILHSFLIECGYDSCIILENVLLNMYGKCDKQLDAQQLFDRITIRDIISWNSIINVYAQQGHLNKTLELFHQMHQEIIPDKVTYLSIIGTFAYQDTLSHAIQLHTQIISNQGDLDTSTGTALINMYGKFGNLKCAKRVFYHMGCRDLVTWASMAMVCSNCGQDDGAKQLFERMLLECNMPDQASFVSFLSAFVAQEDIIEGKHLHVFVLNSSLISDVIVNNSLLNLYGKCGAVEDAQKIFDTMHERDIVSWNSLLSVYNLHSKINEIVFLFNEICCRGCIPDKVTWTSQLSACADMANLVEGKRIHACVRHSGLDSDDIMVMALINMYGKCGEIETAYEIFESLENRSLISWNTMIAAHAQHGMGQQALAIYGHMLEENVVADEATFVSILAACSHSGLLDEACQIYATMPGHGKFTSEDHYACITDLLGRMGRLREAERFIDSLPSGSTTNSLMSLLGACRNHGDVEHGKLIAKRVFELDTENAASYVLLSNLHAVEGNDYDDTDDG